MNIIEVDLGKTKLFSIGQQYNNNALVIHFVNLPNQKNKYIYYKIDDIEKEIPLVSDLFIVSRPLMLHSGEVKAQIITRDENNSIIELTKNFTMRIQPSNYSGIGEDENYPDDPNIKNYFVKIDEKVNSFEELANLVQSKLDNGDFVGAQGPKGDPGEKGDPGDVTEEYRNLASQIAHNASDAQTSATNAQTSASNAQKAFNDTKEFANQTKSEMNQIKTDTNTLKDEANTSATNAKASESKAKEYADNLQASTDDISQLKEDLTEIGESQLLSIKYDVYNGSFSDNSDHNYKHSNIFKVSDLYKIVLNKKNGGMLYGFPITKNNDGSYSYGSKFTISNGQVTTIADITNNVKSKVTTEYIGFESYTSNIEILNTSSDWLSLYSNTVLNERIKNVEDGNLTSFKGLSDCISQNNLCTPMLELKGQIMSDGTHNPSVSSGMPYYNKTSEFIKVEGNGIFLYGFVKGGLVTTLWHCWCFYDENYSIIGSRIVNTDSTLLEDDYRMFKHELTLPSGTKYFRFSSNTYDCGYYAVTTKDVGLITIEDLKYQQTKIEENEELINNVVNDKTNKYLINSIEMQSNIKSVAHRGYSDVAPENTLSAFRLAKEKGFMYVETDVRTTSDGVLVLLHDDTVDRTSDGSGSISSMTFAQARAFDFGSWKSSVYEGEKIPSFDEFLELCKKIGLKAYVEIKDGTLIEKIGEAIMKKGMGNSVRWVTSDINFATRALTAVPNSEFHFLRASQTLVEWAISHDNVSVSFGVRKNFNPSNATEYELIAMNHGYDLHTDIIDEVDILNLNPCISAVGTGGPLASVVWYNSIMNN